MKYLILLLLFSSVSFAQVYHIDPEGLTEPQLKNFQLHLEKLKQYLPKSFKRIGKLDVEFEEFEVDRDSKHLGEYSSFFNRITINSTIVPESGESYELIKVLIHELTHAYEDKVKKLHNDLKFWYLSGWHKRGAVFYTRDRRNFMESRSPDPYEFSHPRETLAVNMEYFLTDHTYQCRRPLLFNYLSEVTGHIVPWIECPLPPDAPVAMNNQILWTQLYSKRLYSVHYLMASEGDEVMSRFGHSMLRLVFCSPKREVVSKECLKDVEHHLVLSYRANITDLVLSYWGGLVGKYPSQLFLLTLSQVIQEYNKVELRDLISVPLNLSFKEKENIIPLVLSEVWSYRGKYRFVTQNCATETMDFLKMLIDNKKLVKTKVTTPKGVLKKLKKLKIADDSEVYGKDAKNYGYFFESKRKKYLKIFKKIQAFFPQYDDLDEYLEDSTVQQRSEKFSEMVQTRVPKAVAASMYVMEKQIQDMKTKKFFDKATRRILMGSEAPEELREYVKRRILPKDMSTIEESLGYGIPLPREFSVVREFLSSPKDEVIAEQMTEWLKENLKREFEELLLIKDNLEVFQSYLREG